MLVVVIRLGGAAIRHVRVCDGGRVGRRRRVRNRCGGGRRLRINRRHFARVAQCQRVVDLSGLASRLAIGTANRVQRSLDLVAIDGDIDFGRQVVERHPRGLGLDFASAAFHREAGRPARVQPNIRKRLHARGLFLDQRQRQ
jgi:hypothetical protein